jgi:hypothetical protein
LRRLPAQRKIGKMRQQRKNETASNQFWRGSSEGVAQRQHQTAARDEIAKEGSRPRAGTSIKPKHNDADRLERDQRQYEIDEAGIGKDAHDAPPA